MQPAPVHIPFAPLLHVSVHVFVPVHSTWQLALLSQLTLQSAFVQVILHCAPLEHLIPQLELAQVYEQVVPVPSQSIWHPPVVQIPEQESFEQLQPAEQSKMVPLDEPDELDVVVFPDELDVLSLPELLDELSAPPMPPIPPTPPAPPEAPLELVASVDCEGGV